MHNEICHVVQDRYGGGIVDFDILSAFNKTAAALGQPNFVYRSSGPPTTFGDQTVPFYAVVTQVWGRVISVRVSLAQLVLLSAADAASGVCTRRVIPSPTPPRPLGGTTKTTP